MLIFKVYSSTKHRKPQGSQPPEEIEPETRGTPKPRIYNQHQPPKSQQAQQKCIKFQNKTMQKKSVYKTSDLRTSQKPLYRTTALEQKLICIHRRHTYAFDSLPTFKPYKKHSKGNGKFIAILFFVYCSLL